MRHECFWSDQFTPPPPFVNTKVDKRPYVSVEKLSSENHLFFLQAAKNLNKNYYDLITNDPVVKKIKASFGHGVNIVLVKESFNRAMNSNK